MIIMSRRQDEQIVIGDNIVITVADIRGDKVRLAIESPLEVPVFREEVYRAIQSNRRAAEAQGSQSVPCEHDDEWSR